MKLALDIFLIITSLLLMLFILLHRGKGGGLSSLFGGGVQSSLSGSSVVERNLDRVTVIVAVLWLIGIVAVGLVVNVIATTGIGNTFSLMINDWAGGSLLLTIVLVALVSLVLGMGLPVTAAYVVLATLSAPALYVLIAQAQLVDLIAAGALPEAAKAIFMLTAPDGLAALAQPMPESEAWALLAAVPSDFRTQLLQQALSPAALTTALLSAHMIIFWLSQDSNVTPPVCLAAFAAATDLDQLKEARLAHAGDRSPLAARGMMPAPMMLLTSTATALAACGLLRTRSRIRSRKSAPATPISVSAEDPGARQPSVRRPRAAPS